MEKILLLSCLILLSAGCAQSPPAALINQDVVIPKSNETEITEPSVEEKVDINNKEEINVNWLTNKLIKNFADKDYEIGLGDSLRLGPDYNRTTAVSFKKDYNVGLIMFDNNHEMYGNDFEFKDAIARYSTDKYYGEVILEEKYVHPEILLQYTKTGVMANHSSMKNVYFFTLPNKDMLKVEVTYNAEPDTLDEKQQAVIDNRLKEIHEILMQEI